MVKSIKRHLNVIANMVDAVGYRKAALNILEYLVTSPRIWEPFVVTKVRGKKLQQALGNLLSRDDDGLVSVILPVNNGRSKGVERLVESLKRQSYKKIEYIAVDSGSTDDTVEYLKGAGFRVIEIPPEKFSHSYSRNTGAEAARGEYLLFVVDDAVFHDPDWIKNALAILNYYQADSLSTSQVVDQGADHYARLLSYYLATAQSDSLSINISKTNWFIKKMRPYLPMRALFRSVCIDDTNHLSKKSTFDTLRFDAPTVEDIDYAIRLTQAGGRVVYTNLLCITHYHSYALDQIEKYAKRVYLDAKQITKWARAPYKLYSRDAYLLGAYHTLALVYRTLNQFVDLYGHHKDNSELLSDTEIRQLITMLGINLGRGVPICGNFHDTNYMSAETMFRRICGGFPPSNLFFDNQAYFRFSSGFVDSLAGVINALETGTLGALNLNDFETIITHQWCQRLMFTLADESLFQFKHNEYVFDNWNISNWA